MPFHCIDSYFIMDDYGYETIYSNNADSIINRIRKFPAAVDQIKLITGIDLN